MEPIRYLPRSDLALPFYVEKAISIVSQVVETEFSPDINDIISIFNILRYMDDGLEQQLGNPDRKPLKRLIIEFSQSRGVSGVFADFNKLYRWLNDDFWQFFVSFRLEKKLKEKDFSDFLSTQKPNIRPILFQKKLCNKFRWPIREYFLSDLRNVSYLIEEKEIKYSPSPAIPKDITLEDKLSLISAYIGSETPSFGYLEIFAKTKEIPTRVRLAAQRRANEVRTQVFKSSTTYKFGVQVSFKEQTEPVEVELENGIAKYSYDLDWIRTNPDKATLLNNFIYLFEYVDDQNRMNLCFQTYEQGVIERTMSKQRTDWHPDSIAFTHKNHAAFLQLHSYSSILNSLGTSIEELINWFFREYMKTEFKINNFQADLPEGDRPFVEKCKLLAPEIERILRQFQLFVEDGQIDHDLLALETKPFVPSATGSFLERKYCYLNSKDGERATYYFYSDQCMLSYCSRSQKSYETFANRLSQQNPRKDDFEEYQKPELDWLEQKGYVRFDKEGIVEPANVPRIVFLGEIFRNGCLWYGAYKGAWKDALDTMITDGTLRVESSLFSEPEAKYIDYHLNKRSFINSLDLRNKYAHGSHMGSGEREQEHEFNYFQMLKIVVCIVLKINDELCLR